jgi:osmotically-inducible protein OsmY
VTEVLKREADMKGNNIKVAVVNGWVTLSGCADHVVQWAMADCTVRCVGGVKGVTNVMDIGGAHHHHIHQARHQ